MSTDDELDARFLELGVHYETEFDVEKGLARLRAADFGLTDPKSTKDATLLKRNRRRMPWRLGLTEVASERSGRTQSYPTTSAKPGRASMPHSIQAKRDAVSVWWIIARSTGFVVTTTVMVSAMLTHAPAFVVGALAAVAVNAFSMLRRRWATERWLSASLSARARAARKASAARAEPAATAPREETSN